MDSYKTDIIGGISRKIEVLRSIVLYIIYKFQSKYKEGIDISLLNLFCYLVDGVRKMFRFKLGYMDISCKYVYKVLWDIVSTGELFRYYDSRYGYYKFRFKDVDGYDFSKFICNDVKDYQLRKIDYLVERYSSESIEDIRSMLFRVVLKTYLRRDMKVTDSRDADIICSNIFNEKRGEMKKFVGREYVIHKRRKILALIYYLVLEYQWIKGMEIRSGELYRIIGEVLKKIGIRDVEFDELNGEMYSKEISYYIYLLKLTNFIEGICNEGGEVDRYRAKVVERFPLGSLDCDEKEYILEAIKDS